MRRALSNGVRAGGLSRSFLTAVSALVLWPAAVAGAQDEPTERLDLQELIEEVIASNPDIAAFGFEVEGRRAAGEAAAAFPDPMVGLGFNDVGTSFSGRENMMSMRELMLRQTFPWPGKRALRQEVQDLLAEAAEHGGRATALALAQATTQAYADLWLAIESRRTRESRREALSDVLELASARYEALDATLSDPLRAELAVAAIEEPLAELDEREAEARAVLAALAARPADPFVGDPVLPAAPAVPDFADELLAVIDRHPALHEMAGRRDSLLASARLAEREVYPDIQVGLGYGQRDAAPDMIGVEVMVPVPLFGRARRAGEAEASRSDARAADQRLRARRDELMRDARAAHATARRAQRVHALWTDEILALARDNVAAAGVAYEGGRIEFLTYLDAQVELYEQELNLLRARATLTTSLARLERALGASPGTLITRQAGGLGDESAQPGSNQSP